MDLEEIEKRVAELDTLFGRVEDDSEDFDDDLAAVPTMDLSAYLAFLVKRARTPYGRAFSKLRELVVPALLDAYLRMSDDDRRAVLDLFSNHSFALIALWSLLDEVRWRLQKAPPHERPAVLRNLLLIAVLAEEYLDQVDTAMILTSAWGAAEDSGLDPAPFFKAAADVAGQRELSHGESARQILRDFEPYDYGRPAKG